MAGQGGPDEETWKRMTPGQKLGYGISVIIVFGIIIILSVIGLIRRAEPLDMQPMTEGRAEGAMHNSIASMQETVEDVSTAAGLRFNSDACTSINKVGLRPGRMITIFECTVPEPARALLRSEFLARGWSSEKILDGAMSKFRKFDQTASVYCDFKAATCKLRLEYAPRNK